MSLRSRIIPSLRLLRPSSIRPRSSPIRIPSCHLQPASATRYRYYTVSASKSTTLPTPPSSTTEPPVTAQSAEEAGPDKDIEHVIIEENADEEEGKDHMNETERAVYDKLDKALGPTKLEVRDVSGGCGSMFAISIESPQFQGLSMMKQHRAVQDVLAEEIKGWHGVQLRTKVS